MAFVEDYDINVCRHLVQGVDVWLNNPRRPLEASGTSIAEMLNEHFRCAEPIIRFSFQFYPKEIIPLRIPKDSERLDPPLIDVYVINGQKDARKVNRAEAVAIADEIERLVNDPAYHDRTIGVVTLLGWEQAEEIQGLLQQCRRPR